MNKINKKKGKDLGRTAYLHLEFKRLVSYLSLCTYVLDQCLEMACIVGVRPHEIRAKIVCSPLYLCVLCQIGQAIEESELGIVLRKQPMDLDRRDSEKQNLNVNITYFLFHRNRGRKEVLSLFWWVDK